jgi:hypothetical protein
MKATRGNEFNFSQYITQLKEQMTNFITQVVNKRNEYGEGVEIIVDKRGHHKPHHKNKHENKHFDKRNNQKFEELKEDKPQLQSITPDYGFVFESWTKLIKEYIQDRIKQEKLREDLFVFPRETLYQLIIVIDKLDIVKLSELQSLSNFAIELGVTRTLRRMILQGLGDKEDLFSILDVLEMRKILIIFKYFQISYKKIEKLFYKLGID